MKLEGAAESALRTNEFMALTQQNAQTSSLDVLIIVSY